MASSNDVEMASKYTFVRRLNSGSFGDVYLGLDPNGHEVAIKVLIGGEEGDPDAIQRELFFCKLVDHPNIVKTHEVMQVSDDWWFVTEFCAHGDLFGAILPLQGVCDEGRIKKFFTQLVDAVAYLHDQDIVHRDVKPENCLLTADDDLKLCDFGLSGFDSDEWETGIGTFPYMAPEVYQLHRTTTVHSHKAADVWSVGVTLYTMLKGMLPWDAPSLSDPDYEAFREHKGRFGVAGWSEDLHELFAGMLHWDPQKRLTIHEIQDMLQNMVHTDWLYAATNENLAAPIVGRMDSDLRRPRTPEGQADYIVFGMDDANSDGVSDAEFESRYDPQLLLPPKRRTRYDSELLEIEFNPYVEDGEMYVVRRSPYSDTSDDTETDDDGGWFNKSASMSFSKMSKFEDGMSVSASASPLPGNSHTPGARTRPRFTFGADPDDNSESEGDESGPDDAIHARAEHRDSGVSTHTEGRSWEDMDREMSFSILPQFDTLKISDDGDDHHHASSPSATPLASGSKTALRFAAAPSNVAAQGTPRLGSAESSDFSSDDSGLGADLTSATRSQATIPTVIRSGTGSAVGSRPPSALGMNTQAYPASMRG